MRTSSASPLLPLFAALSLVGLAALWPARREAAPAPVPVEAPRPPAPATPTPAPPAIRDDAELARLRAEIKRLHAELETARGSLDKNEETLARTTRELERLRRPLDVDMASATLRANLTPGEGVVTGGYRLPDGTRLFAFVETAALAEGGIGVESRFFAVPEELVQRLGLQTLSTEAANTLQHGEVWIRDELREITGVLAQMPGARLLASGDTAIQPGQPGELALPSRPGDPPLSLNVNAVYDERRNLDFELRVESAPATSAESAAKPSETAAP